MLSFPLKIQCHLEISNGVLEHFARLEDRAVVVKCVQCCEVVEFLQLENELRCGEGCERHRRVGRDTNIGCYEHRDAPPICSPAHFDCFASSFIPSAGVHHILNYPSHILTFDFCSRWAELTKLVHQIASCVNTDSEIGRTGCGVRSDQEPHTLIVGNRLLFNSIDYMQPPPSSSPR